MWRVLTVVFWGAQVSFFDFGENNDKEEKWLSKYLKWVIVGDVLFGLMTWTTWSSFTKEVVARDDEKKSI